MRELPVLQPTAPRADAGLSTGAAHANARDAYRDVPILQPPTWHNLVAGYFYFGGISSGAFAIGAVASLVNEERYTSIARTAHYVSFAAMLPCPWLLILDLGKPELFYHMLRIFKPSSPMNLGSWALTTHGAFATLTMLGTAARQFKIPVVGPLLRVLPERVMLAGGLPSSLTLGGYTGVLIGTTSVPVWYASPLLGALFMASAMSTGLAAVNLSSVLLDKEHQSPNMAPLGLIFSGVESGLLAAYFVTAGTHAAPLLRGREGLQMAGCVALLLLSLALEGADAGTEHPSRMRTGGAAAATLAAGALLRWAFVFAGKSSARDREGTLRAMGSSRGAHAWQRLWQGLRGQAASRRVISR